MTKFVTCASCRTLLPSSAIVHDSVCGFCAYCNLVKQFESGKAASVGALFEDRIFWVKEPVAYRINFLVLAHSAFEGANDEAAKRVAMLFEHAKKILENAVTTHSISLQESRKKWLNARKYCEFSSFLTQTRSGSERTGLIPYVFPNARPFLRSLEKQKILDEWKQAMQGVVRDKISAK